MNLLRGCCRHNGGNFPTGSNEAQSIQGEAIFDDTVVAGISKPHDITKGFNTLWGAELAGAHAGIPVTKNY